MSAAAVFLDVENVFHPYGRSTTGLVQEWRARLEATHPEVTPAAALRLGASAALDLVDWIDARYTRSVSVAVGKTRDIGVGEVAGALADSGFASVSAPDGKNRADYLVVSRLFDRLGETQTVGAYLVGSDDSLVVGAFAEGARAVVTGRAADGEDPARFHILTAALPPKRRRWYGEDDRKGLAHIQLTDAVAWSRRIRSHNAAKAKARRARLLRILTSDPADLAGRSKACRDFAICVIYVAKVAAERTDGEDRPAWIGRVHRTLEEIGAIASYSTVLMAALAEPAPGDAAADPTPADELVATVLDILVSLGFAAGTDAQVHAAVAASSPAVQRAFLRWTDHTDVERPSEATDHSGT